MIHQTLQKKNILILSVHPTLFYQSSHHPSLRLSIHYPVFAYDSVHSFSLLFLLDLNGLTGNYGNLSQEMSKTAIQAIQSNSVKTAGKLMTASDLFFPHCFGCQSATVVTPEGLFIVVK